MMLCVLNPEDYITSAAKYMLLCVSTVFFLFIYFLQFYNTFHPFDYIQCMHLQWRRLLFNQVM